MARDKIGLIMVMLVCASLCVSAVQLDLVTGPIYSSPNLAPTAYLETTGGTVNVVGRTGRYAFEGEQITWNILAIDNNGVSDLSKVRIKSESVTMDCSAGTQLTDGASLSGYGLSGTFDSDYMKIYKCIYTVLATGTQHFYAEATDASSAVGTSTPTDNWVLDPTVSLTTSGTLNFGTLSAGQVGSSTITFTNNGITKLEMRISGTDFYDPVHSGALCPTSNVLSIAGDGAGFTTGMWYKATMGATTTPNMRIPYGLTYASAGQIMSGQTLASGATMSVAFKLGLPTPCIGTFTAGHVYVYGEAI